MVQLHLPFITPPDYAEADLIPTLANASVLAWLERTSAWPSSRFALWGDAGSGKTHLLHIWARRQGTAVVRGQMLRDWPDQWPDGVAVDNADSAPPEALLHLLNALAEAGQPVLMAARLPPAQWSASLPDLRSRLRATMAEWVRPADDATLQALLVRWLAERQLSVPDTLMDWLHPRLPRQPAALRNTITLLDRAAMASGRGLTKGVAASVLQRV